MLKGTKTLLLPMKRRASSGAYTWTNAEGATWVASGGSITNTDATLVDAMITSLKGTGEWSLFSELYLFLGNNLASALIPWVVTSGNNPLTWKGTAGTYTKTGGVTLTSALRTGFSPSEFASNTSNAFGFWNMTAYTTSEMRPMGCNDASEANRHWIRSESTPNISGYAGATTGASWGNANSRNPALCIVTRTAGNRLDTTINGVSVANSTTSVTPTLSTNEMYVGAVNNNGTANKSYTGAGGCAMIFNTGVSVAQTLNIYNALKTMYDSMERTGL